MNKEERWQKILETISMMGSINVDSICDQYGVSDMTARRDLIELDRAGLLRRIHGGAINSLGRSYEPQYQVRLNQQNQLKNAIALKACELIADGDSIVLDVGTTTYAMVKGIQGKHNLTILTASLQIAYEIASTLAIGTDIRLIISGGIVRPSELSMIGHLAERTFDEIHVDKVFMGIGGISLEAGLTEYNLEDAIVKRHLLKNARQVIIVSDSSKFGRTTFASVGPISIIDTIITDTSAPVNIVKSLKEMGIEVVQVEVHPDKL